MADQPNQEQLKRYIPALSFGTVTNFLDQFKSPEQVPTHIDKSMFPSTMSGANQTALLSSLKFFGFISEDAKPQEVFYEFVSADKDRRASIWHGLLTTSYSFVLAHVDIERSTSAQVAECFRTQGISGDTVRKAVTFFLHATKTANMKVSSHVKAPRPTRATGGRRGRSADHSKQDTGSLNGGGSGGELNIHTARTDRTPYEMLIDILNARMTKEEQDAVWTLIRYMKAKEAESE
jgi:hypothetical protein